MYVCMYADAHTKCVLPDSLVSVCIRVYVYICVYVRDNYYS